MAGKKQNRTPSGKAASAEEQAAAAAASGHRRVISLAGGTWCYLHMHDGRSLHLKVDSDRMQQALAEAGALSEPFRKRLLTEMSALKGDFPAAAARHVRELAGEDG